MTRIAVLSDTHKSVGYIRRFLDQMQQHQPELIFHLGDDYQDADYLIAAGYSVVRVPGTWTPEYQNPNIENRRYELVEDWRFFLTHTPTIDSHDLPGDSDPQRILKSGTCDFFLHGHTHRPGIWQVEGVTVVNPGHLFERDNRGYPPSYAIFDVALDQVSVQIFELFNQKIYQAVQFQKG